MQVGNFIHHLATFVSGYIVGFIKSWQVSLVVFAVTPLMIICGKVQRSVYIDLASKEEVHSPPTIYFAGHVPYSRLPVFCSFWSVWTMSVGGLP